MLKLLGRGMVGWNRSFVEFSNIKCGEKLAEVQGFSFGTGLTEPKWHPTKMIADFLTIKENFGKVEGIISCICWTDGPVIIWQNSFIGLRLILVNIHIVNT